VRGRCSLAWRPPHELQPGEAVIAADRHLIDNPVTGEHIVIYRSTGETGGELLAWELRLDPGGRVPSSHAHPEQEERFTVVSGRLRLRIGRGTIIAGPGDTVAVPPRTVHSFANIGRIPVLVMVETRPALRMEQLLETAAAMAAEQRSTSRLLPNPIQLALFMRDFDREVSAPYLPPGLVHLATGMVAALAKWLRLDARYQRVRAIGAQHAQT
jgi:quercetin dioxygenase-like cupin family protein